MDPRVWPEDDVGEEERAFQRPVAAVTFDSWGSRFLPSVILGPDPRIHAARRTVSGGAGRFRRDPAMSPHPPRRLFPARPIMVNDRLTP